MREKMENEREYINRMCMSEWACMSLCVWVWVCVCERSSIYVRVEVC